MLVIFIAASCPAAGLLFEGRGNLLLLAGTRGNLWSILVHGGASALRPGDSTHGTGSSERNAAGMALRVHGHENRNRDDS